MFKESFCFFNKLLLLLNLNLEIKYRYTSGFKPIVSKLKNQTDSVKFFKILLFDTNCIHHYLNSHSCSPKLRNWI